jgi:hypothetical protein
MRAARKTRAGDEEEEGHPSRRGGRYFNHRVRVLDAVVHGHLNDRITCLDGQRHRLRGFGCRVGILR